MTQRPEHLLKEYVRELIERVIPYGVGTPTWTDVLLLEDEQIDWQNRAAPARALITLEGFVPFFSALLGRSPSWIKLAAEGIWKNHLVVVVSASPTASSHIGAQGNILYSGLTNTVASDPEWSVERAFRIVGS